MDKIPSENFNICVRGSLHEQQGAHIFFIWLEISLTFMY